MAVLRASLEMPLPKTNQLQEARGVDLAAGEAPERTSSQPHPQRVAGVRVLLLRYQLQPRTGRRRLEGRNHV